MRAPLGEWWITLTASYIIFVRLPNITSTDKSVGTKFCLLWGQGKYFLCVKNLHSSDLLLHNDWSEQHFHIRRWTEAHLREFTCAYLSSPAGDSCSASVHAAFRDEGAEGIREDRLTGKAASFLTMMWNSSEPLRLQKRNRIKLSVTTNVFHHGRMMKCLLWMRILISLFSASCSKTV